MMGVEDGLVFVFHARTFVAWIFPHALHPVLLTISASGVPDFEAEAEKKIIFIIFYYVSLPFYFFLIHMSLLHRVWRVCLPLPKIPHRIHFRADLLGVGMENVLDVP